MTKAKKIFMLVIMTVFLWNTLSLSAYANSCEKNNPQTNQAKADLPDCHKKSETKPPQSKHCEGICFCQHILLNAHIMTAPDMGIAIIPIKETLIQGFHTALKTQTPPPPYKPPIFVS